MGCVLVGGVGGAAREGSVVHVAISDFFSPAPPEAEGFGARAAPLLPPDDQLRPEGGCLPPPVRLGAAVGSFRPSNARFLIKK